MSTKPMTLGSLSPMNVREKRQVRFEPSVAVAPAEDSRRHRQDYWQTVARWCVGPLAIAALTEFFLHGLTVNATTVGFAFLLAILIASTFLELRSAILMCVVATAVYDYFFLPPAGSFNINDPQDWVALTSFLVTALIGTKLSATSRRKADEATRRRLEAERLYALSHRLLKAENTAALFGTIPINVADSLGLDDATLYVSEKEKVFGANLERHGLKIDDLRAAAGVSHPQVNEQGNISLAPVRLGNSVYGSLALFGAASSREMIDATAALVAVAIARARALEQVAKVEAARESERLKSVLLDAITHDFRTPLTSIKISTTGLLEDLDFDREQRKELLLIIDEECDRISRLVGEASEMARLECGEVKLEIAAHSVKDLISGALSDCRNSICNREIRVEMPRPEQRLSMDIHLATKVLVHLVSNAHLYSAPGEPIIVRAEERDGLEYISVADRGAGIDSKELSLIFEKFYRGRKQRHRVQGTGMGLAIAKAIVEAHGGTISATSRPGQGSVFTFSLPLEHEYVRA